MAFVGSARTIFRSRKRQRHDTKNITGTNERKTAAEEPVTINSVERERERERERETERERIMHVRVDDKKRRRGDQYSGARRANPTPLETFNTRTGSNEKWKSLDYYSRRTSRTRSNRTSYNVSFATRCNHPLENSATCNSNNFPSLVVRETNFSRTGKT